MDEPLPFDSADNVASGEAGELGEASMASRFVDAYLTVLHVEVLSISVEPALQEKQKMSLATGPWENQV